jgi:MFS family permease
VTEPGDPTAPAPAAPGRLPRTAFFALLYFSEGAPIGYVWWAMPTRLRDAGMPVEQVAAITALLTLPWALKFLWAPAVDRLRGRRWGYRAWITVAQVAMGLALLPLGLLPAADLLGVVKWLLLAHAFAAATQDVAIDALAVATIPHDDRGRTTAWMQAGMLAGRACFGGLALAAEDWIGARAVVLILIGCVWFTLLVVWCFPHAPAATLGDRQRHPRFWSVVARVLARRSTWLGLGVAVTAGAGFEAVGGLMGSFLIDRGVDSAEVGWFFAIPVIACMVVGGLAGGRLADRFGHRVLVGASVAVLFAGIVTLALVDHLARPGGLAPMALAVPIYLCVGSLTASSYALFMDLTDPEIGGTQFSSFMGATNLCEVWAVALAGMLVARSGYPLAFAACAALSLVALPMLPLIPGGPPRDRASAPAA